MDVNEVVRVRANRNNRISSFLTTSQTYSVFYGCTEYKNLENL